MELCRLSFEYFLLQSYLCSLLLLRRSKVLRLESKTKQLLDAHAIVTEQMELQRIIISPPVILQGVFIQSPLTLLVELKPLLVVFHYKSIKGLFQMQELWFNLQGLVQHTLAPALSVGHWIGRPQVQEAVQSTWHSQFFKQMQIPKIQAIPGTQHRPQLLNPSHQINLLLLQI